MSVAETIRQKLSRSFKIERLEIEDQSYLHRGHAGAPAGGESHFRVTIVSADFDGESRVSRQRLVYGALKDELAGPVHALALKAMTVAEADDEAATAD
jgi:BolA protein